jgi:hypothetical protein
MLTLSPTQSNVQAAVRAFLQAVLPGLPGQDPAVFLGSIAGGVLTVAALPILSTGGIQGTVQPGAPLLGFGVAPGTLILSQLSGATGGVGTYQINTTQTLASATMSTGVTVVAGQPNRTVEPANPYFAVVSEMFGIRLGTNFDDNEDCKFTGSIAGTTMTVTSIFHDSTGNPHGVVVPGATLFGVNVAASTQILRQLTGTPGSTGTYQLTVSQTLASQTLSSGLKGMTAPQKIELQVDFHSPDFVSRDFAQTMSVAIRDEYATKFFSNLAAPLSGISPLYADDPKQVPFINAENQYEWRWILEVCLQANEFFQVPQDFADQVLVGRVPVDLFYR